MKKMIVNFGRETLSFRKFPKLSFPGFSTQNNFVSIKTQTIDLKTTIDNKTIADLTKEIQKFGNYDRIDFRIWDHSKVSNNTKLSTIKEPLYLRIQDSNWIELNLNKLTQPEGKTGEDLFLNLTENLDANERDKARKIYTRIRNHEYNTIENKLFSAKNTNLASIIEDLNMLKKEYIQYNSNEEKLKRSSEKKVLAVMMIAGLLFVVELAFIYYCTFIKYSWDITEPMTYLITCANVVLFLMLRRKFGSLSAFEYLTNFFMKRRTSIHKLNDIQKKIRAIENKLN